MSTIIGLCGGGGDYTKAISDAGGIPLSMPVVNKENIEEIMEQVHGIVLCGGSDIDPLRYNERDHPYLQGTSPARDNQEFLIFDYVYHKTKKPIIGICRGLQLMNAALGGTLWQDITSQMPTHMHSGSAMTFGESHLVEIDQDCRMRKFFPQFISVNSFHHQGIKDLAPDLRASGWSPDGIIEAVESKDDLFRMAFQWHPESLYDRHSHYADMFSAFVAASNVSKKAKKLTRKS